MSVNLDLVRSIYADWERGDFTHVSWAHPEIELAMPDMPDPGRWIGIPATARAWRAWLATWSEYRAEPEAFREVDSARVLVVIRSVARGKTSGVDVHTRNANVFEISDGKVTRITLCSLETARADLGLEE
jgi:ketosteroid isomerase-like protein